MSNLFDPGLKDENTEKQEKRNNKKIKLNA